MAGTITKNLKLKAVLDDQAFRKQIQELKKELGGVELGGAGGNVGGLDRSAKLLADAAQALKQAVDSFRRGVSGPGGGGTSSSSSRENVKIKQLFDAERAKYVNLKAGQVYDPEMGKVFKREEDHEKAKAAFREKAQAKEQERALRGADKVAKQEARSKEQERRKDLAASKDAVTALLSRTGMGLPMARQVAQAMGSSAPGAMESAGGFLRGSSASSGMIGLGGIAAGTAGALNLGADFYFQHNRIATAQANREQTTGRGLLRGEGAESAVYEKALNDPTARFLGGAQGAMGGAFSGGLKGAAAGATLGAGVGAFFGGIGAVPGALVGGAIGGIAGIATGGILGAQEGAEKGGESERAKVQAQIAFASDVKKQAKALREARVSAMRGGAAIPMQLDYLQGEGAMRGFGAEQTLQQFSGAKQFLGKDAANLLPVMQSRMNMTGVSTEEQAAATEALMGAKKGTSASAAFGQTFEVLKKGVAAGLDVSKSGQFLKLTTDYIRGTQGLGQVDTDAIATRLADAAAGFAGGGPITQTSLQQAGQLQDMLTKESASSEGFAGLGKIKAIQENFGGQMDAGQFLALQNMSQNATADDIKKIMPNASDEQIAKFQKAMQNTQAMGIGMTGASGALATALGAGERGIYTEQQLGAEAAQKFKANGPTAETTAQIQAGDVQSADKASLILDFKVQQEAFSKGVNLMGLEAANSSELLKVFNEQLRRSVRAFESQLGVRNKDGN